MATRKAATMTGNQQAVRRGEGLEPNAKSERLAARLTSRQKELLQRAADLTGRSLTDFIVSSALERAETTIRSYEVLELSERDAKAFFEALDNPPKLNAKLSEAMRRHSESVEMR